MPSTYAIYQCCHKNILYEVAKTHEPINTSTVKKQKKKVGKQETCFSRLPRSKYLSPLSPESRQLTFSHFPHRKRRHPPLGETMGGRSQHMPARQDMQLKLLRDSEPKLYMHLRAQVHTLMVGSSFVITCSSYSASYK